MRLFTDGAEFGDILELSSVGTPASEGVSSAQARSGTYSYYSGGVEGSTRWIEKTFTASSEIFYRFGVRRAGAQDMNIAIVKSGTTQIGYLKVPGATGKIEIYVGSSTKVATSTITIPVGSWMLIEWHLKIDDSVGVSEVKIEGVLDATFTGDTKPDTNTTVNFMRHCSYNWDSTYYDDLAVNNTDNSDGKGDTSWCGEGRVEILMPNGNGNVNEWTGSDSNSTDNYLLVDDKPPSSADYVEDSTPGNQDAYALTDFTGTNKQILRVWAAARAIDTVPEGAQMKIGIRTNSTDYLSSAKTLLTVYGPVIGDEYKVNPNDSGAWEDADLDALELVLETV